MRHWLLPEYIEDVLPADAARLEAARRRLLDLFRAHGFDLVIPPMLEYLESLNTGAGHDLDLATFKVVDLLSGRLMGVRADITPQAARMDAHLLNRQGVTRLCYAGSVLRTRPDGLAQTREPLQIGAELFGHAGIESDHEIQQLLVNALQSVGVERLLIDLSHVGIFRGLIARAGVDQEREQELLQALQYKDKASLTALAAPLPRELRAGLLALIELNGGVEVLDAAPKRLPASPEILQALRELSASAAKLTRAGAEVTLDLAELRGYRYHSGLVFAAYAPGCAAPLALGGRYDEVGSAFGRARPATGFSLDLRGLIALLPAQALPAGILAPCLEDDALQRVIAQLRAEGEMVVLELPGHEAYRAELGCDRALVQGAQGWELVPLKVV